ncbi:MAG: DUF1150 family protein [Rhodobacter sp.]|nr:DUF1150 family protein [Paracoccaceae bacterium]MCC0075668.1 DUF1150 family protein [Rhodobacter sp.]
MKTPYPALPDGKIAYIRQVDPASLPDEIRAQLPGDAAVWGVHAEDGEMLALARDRKVAFLLARQNDLAPVSAH